MTTLSSHIVRAIRFICPIFAAAALMAPSHSPSARAAAQVVGVYIIDGSICDAAKGGALNATTDQIDNLPHGVATACVIIKTDAGPGDTFSVRTGDASGASVYSAGPFNSPASAGSPVYNLLGPRMTYQANAKNTWPDGTYKTTVTFDGTDVSPTTWAVGAAPTATPIVPTASTTPTPPAVATAVAPAIATAMPTGKPTYRLRANPAYKLRVLWPLPGLSLPFQAVAIDDVGDVLGYTTLTTPVGSSGAVVVTNHVYMLSKTGQLTELHSAGQPVDLEPYAVNQHGEVVAYSYNNGAFVYRAGAWHSVAGGVDAEPHAINDAGQITGFAEIGDGSYAFLSSDRGGPARTLGKLPCGCATWGYAISTKGMVYGFAWDKDGVDHAVAFPPNGGPVKDLNTLPGTTSGEEDAVNASGVAAGVAGINGAIHVTRYDGAQRDLGAIPGWTGGHATGIDKNGWVVGYVTRTEHNVVTDRAFVADNAGPHDLTTLVGLYSSSVIQRAVAENDSGQILAEARLGSGIYPIVLSQTHPGKAILPGKLTGFPALPASASVPVGKNASGDSIYACQYFGYKIGMPSTWGPVLDSGKTFCDPLAPTIDVSPVFKSPDNAGGTVRVFVQRNQASVLAALTSVFSSTVSGTGYVDTTFANGQHLSAGAPLPTTIISTSYASWTAVTYDFGYPGQPSSDHRYLIAGTRRPDGYTWIYLADLYSDPSLPNGTLYWTQIQHILTTLQPIPGSPYETTKNPPGNVG